MATCYPLSAGNWLQSEWPWGLNDLERLFDVKIRFRPTLCWSIDAFFGAHCTNLNEDRPILSATKMQANESSFWKYKVRAYIRGCSLGRGRQTTLGVVDDGYFWRFACISYVFENFKDIRQAINCDDMLPLVDRQMSAKWMTLSGYFMIKCVFGPALLESERLNVRNSTTSAILRCSVHCTIS